MVAMGLLGEWICDGRREQQGGEIREWAEQQAALPAVERKVGGGGWTLADLPYCVETGSLRGGSVLHRGSPIAVSEQPMHHPRPGLKSILNPI